MATRRREPEARSVGRSQGGRPHLGISAQARESGERGLVGALSVPIEQLVPDPGQPRRDFDPARLAELAASIAEYGILQPLVARETGLLDDGRTQYTIVAGGRRYAAALQAGLTRLPVLVRASEGAQLRILQLTENLQREELPAVDEARALKELMDLEALDTRAVAGRLHRSHTYVADRLKLIVHEDVAEAVSRGALTPSAGAEVAREADTARRQDLVQRAYTGRLQKRDVQAIRRRARAEGQPPADGEPTLRQVAREFGASEGQIEAAARARREEPNLSPAEALMLAVSKDDPPAATTPAAPIVDTQVAAEERRAAPGDGADLAGLVAAAGGAGPVLALLDWARGQRLDLAALRGRVRALDGR